MSHSHLLIRASAGSGKTFQLTLRFIALLLTQSAKKSLDTILASTFTRKAAAEISERVILRLAEAVTSDEDREKLIENLCSTFPELKENAALLKLHSRETWQSLLTQLVRQIHRLRIGTLDSFFIKMANAFAFELGLPPHLSISEDTERDSLIVEATRVVLESDFSDALRLANMLFKGESVITVTTEMIKLAQKLLATFRETPLEVWGGISHLQPLDEEVFAKCVDEYEKCKDEHLPKKKDGTTRVTFAKGHEESVNLLRQAEWDTLVDKGIFKKLLAGEDSFDGCKFADLPELAACLAPLLEHVYVFLRKPIAEQTAATGKLLEKIDAQFQKLQRRDGVYSFGDVSYLLAKNAASSQATNATLLLTQNAVLPLVELMAHRLDSTTEHLLLDEFQDTGRDQWQILQIFIEEMKRERGSFFCVGDTKQAIYGWRGGVVEIFDDVKKKVADAGNPLYDKPLNKSFRSSQIVLDCVNKIFGRLDENAALQIDKKDNNQNAFAAAENWSRRFDTHTAAKEIPGYVVLETAWLAGEEPEEEVGNMRLPNSPEEESSDDGDSSAYDSASEETQTKRPQKDVTLMYAVKKIKELHRNYPQQTIGVLVRRNDAVRKLVAGLRNSSGEDAGIDASEEGGSPLTDSAAVLLIKSLLQLGDHPGNCVARFHLLHSPLAKLLLDVFGFSNLDDNANAAQASQKIRAQIERDGYGDAIRQWSDEYLFAACNSRERARLEKLIEWAYQYDIQYADKTRLDHFVKLLETTKHDSPSQSRVRVMTIHQAKGLEFDIVVLPECDTLFTPNPSNTKLIEGRDDLLAPPMRVVRYVSKKQRQCLPLEYQKDFDTFERNAIEESLCVLYVALTRAKQMLAMIVAPRKPTKEINPAKTWGEILKQALAPKELVFTTESDLILYEQGDKNCFAEKIAAPQKSVAKSKSDKTAYAAPRLQKSESLQFLPPVVKWMSRITPSSHDAKAYSAENIQRTAAENSPQEILMRQAKKGVNDRATAQLFGSAIHRCFQEITWLDENKNLSRDFLVSRMQRELMQKLSRPDQLDWNALYDYFNLCCQQPNVRNLFTRAAFAEELQKLVGAKIKFEVFTERQFLVRRDNQLLRGSIDRLVLVREANSEKILAASIIDIKTDNVIAAEKAAEKYEQQLDAYRFAVQQLYQISGEQIFTQLVFVHS